MANSGDALSAIYLPGTWAKESHQEANKLFRQNKCSSLVAVIYHFSYIPKAVLPYPKTRGDHQHLTSQQCHIWKNHPVCRYRMGPAPVCDRYVTRHLSAEMSTMVPDFGTLKVYAGATEALGPWRCHAEFIVATVRLRESRPCPSFCA